MLSIWKDNQMAVDLPLDCDLEGDFLNFESLLVNAFMPDVFDSSSSSSSSDISTVILAFLARATQESTHCQRLSFPHRQQLKQSATTKHTLRLPNRLRRRSICGQPLLIRNSIYILRPILIIRVLNDNLPLRPLRTLDRHQSH